MHLECVPSSCSQQRSIPFNEGLAVEGSDLNRHGCMVDHLLHCVWWSTNDSSNIAIFVLVKVGFNGIIIVPWCRKEGVVGKAFGWGWDAISGE